jgi:hypothetical protein
MKILIFFVVTICFSNAFAQCTLNNSTLSSSTSLNSTGNKELDNFISSEKINLENFFNVKVEVKITNGFNGLAKQTSSNNYIIELGKDLLSFEYNKKGPVSKEHIGKYMIISIMAHEFAHIFQYTHPEYVFKNSVIQEVHADLLAGFYISKYFLGKFSFEPKLNYELQNKTSILISDLAISFGWMGDTQYWDQQHHGNYYTRSSAFQEPWRCLRGGPTRYSYSNFSDFLKTSVQNTEYQISTFDND